MKLSSVTALVAASVANAHYTFPRLQVNGAMSSDWQYIRQTVNYQSNGPVENVASDMMTCYELNPGRGASGIASFTAGSTVTFSANIGHPGPISFWLAKAPNGQTAATMTGKGNVWYKIYHDQPRGLGTNSITWPTMGASSVSVTLPRCMADGDYLLRVEHIALHSAGNTNGAQLYISCAQIRVTGGTGTLNTGNLVSLPGAYRSNDPGILFQLYWPIPTSYINPGPAPVRC